MTPRADGLEILTAGELSDRPPLLFVHGAFCGAWIWAEHFLPFFAERGWRALAVSLRGHGRSAGRRRLDGFGIGDYVADVAEAAAGLDPPPVVVGHSMGAVVAQRFAQTHRISGLALMSPASLLGLGGSFLHMSLRSPGLIQALARVQSGAIDAADGEAIRRGLFSRDFPLERALRYISLFQRESLRANFELMFPQTFWLPAPPRRPALVIGGADDRFVPVADLALTAMVWRAESRVLQVIPPAAMLASSWPRAADGLADWLARSFDV